MFLYDFCLVLQLRACLHLYHSIIDIKAFLQCLKIMHAVVKCSIASSVHIFISQYIISRHAGLLICLKLLHAVVKCLYLYLCLGIRTIKDQVTGAGTTVYIVSISSN